MASADELKDRKHDVRGQIQQAEKHLDQSSERYAGASRALEKAQSKLDAARHNLSAAQGELAAAAVLDEQLQSKLAAAVMRLHNARAELARGRARVEGQEEYLRQIAVQNYQDVDPSMLGLSMVLSSQHPAELSSALNSVNSVLDKEAVTLDRLDAGRVILTVQEEELETARTEVAAQRRAAAENLLLKEALEVEAQEAEQSVSALVGERARARQEAAKAKAQDRRQLRGLERERSRIESVLAARAEAAREAAAAAAAASAAARDSSAPTPAPAARDSSAPSSPASRSARGLLSYPVDSYITSHYGMRLHPVYRAWSLHDGTDFGAPCGTPIRASTAGLVVEQYFNAGYGNRVILDHGYQAGAGLATSYNHLSGYAVSVGERVERGQVVGYVGSTGYSTGCHLHFMVFRDGATVDPMDWL